MFSDERVQAAEEALLVLGGLDNWSDRNVVMTSSSAFHIIVNAVIGNVQDSLGTVEGGFVHVGGDHDRFAGCSQAYGSDVGRCEM